MNKENAARLYEAVKGTSKDDVSVEGVNHVLETLTERERFVITSIYEDGLPMESIGNVVGGTIERVRQIASKAIRKLRHPSRSKLMTVQGWENYLNPKPKEETDALSELELTVRTYNCLMRAGIMTKTALKSLTDEDLQKIRNLSDAGCQEIKEAREKLL